MTLIVIAIILILTIGVGAYLISLGRKLEGFKFSKKAASKLLGSLKKRNEIGKKMDRINSLVDSNTGLQRHPFRKDS